MKKNYPIYIFLWIICIALPLSAKADSFNVRGVLPWHNFLCGPSAWNEDDYREYLDECQKAGINFIGFHNYTGGAERYATYVEPMVRISARGLTPEAYFDNSQTARWGAVPMSPSGYYFGSEKQLDLDEDNVFGHPWKGEEAYDKAHELMRKVLEMAHQRNMKMAMGFEFGIIPPEYFSQYSPEGRFFWLGQAGMIPNPCNPTAIDIHYSAVDDILDSYPDIDYIWLWLSEHSFMDVDLNMALSDPKFKAKFEAASDFFPNASEQARFLGIWSLEYINLTKRRLEERGSNAKIILGGWGGGNQLPAILEGLDKALDKDIVFSCLNPDLGKLPQPDYLESIGRNRKVWAIPWLEGDHHLWHYQPRVSLMKLHVEKAARQNLDGVCCIHWRTKEVKYNFEAFNDFSKENPSTESVEELYTRYFTEDFGAYAAGLLAPVFTRIDSEQVWRDVSSPEYFAYNPWWGRLDGANRTTRDEILDAIDKALTKMKAGKHKDNLLEFRTIFEFELLLDKAGRVMTEGWNLRNKYLGDGAIPSAEECAHALSLLDDNLLKQVVEAYCARVDNKGDMGILVSINQRLCQSWTELKKFLTGMSNKGMTFHRSFSPMEGWLKAAEKDYRDEMCINGIWDFAPVNAIDSSMAVAMSFDNDVKWEKTGYKVPSPWNVNSFAKGDGGDFRAYPSYPVSWEKAKAGWVRKEVQIPASWTGRRIVLAFDAVAGYSKLFVNGKEICTNSDSFLPFSADITEYVTPGTKAEIRLFIAHNSIFNIPGKFGYRPYVSGSFWGNHIAGIWQDVRMISYPEIYISDVFVKPEVSNGVLKAEVSIVNTTSKPVNSTVGASVRDWHNDAGQNVLLAPEPEWHEGDVVLMSPSSKFRLLPGMNKMEITIPANGKLDLWEIGNPALYGLTVSLKAGPHQDAEWTRFGWREFTISGKTFLLNGKPVIMKGDSWHFMGVPQMTRRYAWSWYTMLKEANGNAVRLHAQVYPEFYLDVADEMGICILDESSVWASDAGPKLDSRKYWDAAAEHIGRMVKRDRNHPSILGWSVTNEVMGVMDGVFHSKNRLGEMAEEINKLAAVAKANDGTRDWISADGEVQHELATTAFLGHYYIRPMIMEWKEVNKPWGIGEMGMCYAGTPVEVSSVNGDKAYMSLYNREEGLAGEAFESISLQRDLGASYTCIFNLAWYALKPLEIGLADTCRSVIPSDGIWFGEYREGVPGMQPERLGPYTTTFNPGYDPRLPLYSKWPLFDGVQAAFSDDYARKQNKWAVKYKTVVDCRPQEAASAVWISSDKDSVQAELLLKAGAEFVPLSDKGRKIIVIDGQYGAEVSKELINAINTGSTAFLWNAGGAASSEIVKAITGEDLRFEERNATSYIVAGKHPVLNGQSESSLYFSEKIKAPLSRYVFKPANAEVLLNPCITDWQKWNWQEETIKTAKVLKSEREKKPEGCVMAVYKIGEGELIVSTLDFFVLDKYANSIVRDMFHNLGVSFSARPEIIPAAIDGEGYVSSALVAGAFSAGNWENTLATDFTSGADFENILPGNDIDGRYWDILAADNGRDWDFLKKDLKGEPENCAVYMSFWVYSPRSLTNLLIDPNIPRVDLEYKADDTLQLYVNGKELKGEAESTAGKTFKGLPLEQGWNHILFKVGQKWGGWNGTFRFTSDTEGFIGKLDSSVIMNIK